jgi:hypothetical protein
MDFPLVIAAPDTTSEEMQGLRNRLRDELLRLPVDDVVPVSAGPAPAGAKAVEALELGALIVSIGQSTGLIAAVVEVVASWMKRQPIHVEVTIGEHTLKGPVTAAQRDALVSAFLEKTGWTP